MSITKSDSPVIMAELAKEDCDNDELEIQTAIETRMSWCPAIRVVVLTVVGILLLLSNISHIYVIVTWESKQECITSGVKEATAIAPFVWLTSWTLWLSTAFYFWYLFILLQRSFGRSESDDVSHSHSWSFRCLFQVALCWSTITLFAYSGSLILSPPSTDAIDTDLCHSFSDSIIQKSQPNAIFWLVMDRIFNFTAHYLCGLVLFFGAYLPREVPYDLPVPYAVLFLIPFCTVLGLVHTFLSPVYDFENIWLICLGLVSGALVAHGQLWCASEHWLHQQRDSRPSESGDARKVVEAAEKQGLDDVEV